MKIRKKNVTLTLVKTSTKVEGPSKRVVRFRLKVLEDGRSRKSEISSEVETNGRRASSQSQR
jgi:hypothetical protein